MSTETPTSFFTLTDIHGHECHLQHPLEIAAVMPHRTLPDHTLVLLDVRQLHKDGQGGVNAFNIILELEGPPEHHLQRIQDWKQRIQQEHQQLHKEQFRELMQPLVDELMRRMDHGSSHDAEEADPQ